MGTTILHDAELDGLPLGKGGLLPFASVDVRMVHEDVAVLAVDGDEAETLVDTEGGRTMQGATRQGRVHTADVVRETDLHSHEPFALAYLEAAKDRLGDGRAPKG